MPHTMQKSILNNFCFINFFDLWLSLASTHHFSICKVYDHPTFQIRYLEQSEGKILEDRYTFMGSVSIFCFWSKSLAVMVVEIQIPHKSPKIDEFSGYPDLHNHDSQRLAPKTKNTPRPHIYIQNFKDFCLRGLQVPPPETSMVWPKKSKNGFQRPNKGLNQKSS